MGWLNSMKLLSKNTGLVFSIIWFLRILQQSFSLLQSLKEPNLPFTRTTASIQSLSSNLKERWGRNLGSNSVFFHTDLFAPLMQTLLALSWRNVCALKARLMYFFQISCTGNQIKRRQRIKPYKFIAVSTANIWFFFPPPSQDYKPNSYKNIPSS